MWLFCVCNLKRFSKPPTFKMHFFKLLEYQLNCSLIANSNLFLCWRMSKIIMYDHFIKDVTSPSKLIQSFDFKWSVFSFGFVKTWKQSKLLANGSKQILKHCYFTLILLLWMVFLFLKIFIVPSSMHMQHHG